MPKIPGNAMGAGLYAAFGVSEALRKHMEFQQAQKDQMERQKLAMEQLSIDRYRAETQVMTDAKRLAADEERHKNLMAREWAQLNFEKAKLKEEAALAKRRLEEVDKPKAEAAGTTAEARMEAARAARERARAQITNKTDKELATTREGVSRIYSRAYEKGVSEYLQTRGNFFKDVFKPGNEELRQEMEEYAINKARTATAPALNLYNELNSQVDAMGSPVGKMMTFEDLEAFPDVQENIKKMRTPGGDTSLEDEWADLVNQPDFEEKLTTGNFIPDEERILEQNHPDMYKKYLLKKAERKATEEPKEQVSTVGPVEPSNPIGTYGYKGPRYTRAQIEAELRKFFPRATDKWIKDRVEQEYKKFGGH